MCWQCRWVCIILNSQNGVQAPKGPATFNHVSLHMKASKRWRAGSMASKDMNRAAENDAWTSAALPAADRHVPWAWYRCIVQVCTEQGYYAYANVSNVYAMITKRAPGVESAILCQRQ